ncbi:ATP-binding cassette sub-family C member 10 [Ischnura elegans]|uniref:ATP-binding cassette sub-family C member 10 n=1 Tax=Ischnura elegans TaxID=197161 RepID=UPI001ED88C1B|nr:ATP-binding cassette sub-family C member 10 [Ischnura elegans]
MELETSDENELAWKELCGPSGFTVWDPSKRDFGLCFQKVCLQFPSFALLAWVSAFYSGNQSIWVSRSSQQLLIINGRSVAVFLLAFLPVVNVVVSLAMAPENLAFIDYVNHGMQCFSWLIHFIYVLALKTRLSVSPRGPSLGIFVWLLNSVVSCIYLRSLAISDFRHSLSLTLNLAFSISSVTLLISYALTLIPSEQMGSSLYEELGQSIQYGSDRPQLLSPGVGSLFSRLSDERDPSYLGVAKEQSSFFSKLTFHWVNPLMRKGFEGKLNCSDDLYDLPLCMSSAVVSYELNQALLGQQQVDSNDSPNRASTSELPNVAYRPSNVSLIRALHKCFGWQFYGIGVLKFIANCANFFGPLLLNALVNFIESRKEPLYYGYIYAFGLLAVTMIAALCNAHFNYFMAEVSLKIRAAVISTIYRKTLLLNHTTISKFSVGEIVNFMSTDTDRIVNSCPSFHAFWSIPFEIAVTLYLLYSQVGLAFLAGLVFSIILIPINKFIASKIGYLSTKLMEQKDHRVKMVTEVLRGIRVLKFHQWENQFIEKINKIRLLELKYLKGRKYLDALCVYFWATTPVFISILTFTTYALMGNKLTAATVFTTLALLNMLISPLNAFPWVLNGLIEAWVSIDRVGKLLKLPDLVLANYYSKIPPNQSILDIALDNVVFNWGSEGVVSDDSPDNGDHPEESFKLGPLSLKVHKGQFIGVTGQVGCGKSTLLAALLAELDKDQGSISLSEIDSGFGYVSQKPWLQRASVKDNILFGKTYDLVKYKAVIEACSLVEDLKLLPKGDMTLIGEGGETLSGGQKARIALARAVYQDKSIYLLDDVLSAVDVHVAHNIFQKCINGLLRDKTKILCTHQVQYFLTADKVYVLENGKIIAQGKPGDILSDIDEITAQMESLDDEYLPVKRKISRVVKDGDDLSITSSILSKGEEKESGAVKLSIYANYWFAVGQILAVFILLSMFFMQVSRNTADWWLSYWVTHSTPSNASHSSASGFNEEDSFHEMSETLSDYSNSSKYYADEAVYYLSIYGSIVCLNTVFTLLRAFLFAYGGICAAKNIHTLLLDTVIKARVVFFDLSPLGRILNRFSSDTYTVDDSLPFIMNILFAQLFSVVGAVFVTVYGIPWLLLILVPLIPLYYWLQNHYRRTSRELKRLSSVTLSPLYSHFNETLQGLQTIRAYRAVSRFKLENEEHLEANQKAQLASQAAGQWLGLRIQFIGVVIVGGVGLIAVIQHQFSVANPGLIGLAISYALSVSGLLGGVVNAFVETEREMVAVERVYQYINNVEPEEAKDTPTVACPYVWPFQGAIVFNNVVLKYRENIPPSLKGVSFQTRPAEKIGIVGRTGAGKSSLFAALFRLTELSEGDIFVDTVNISFIKLSDLRSRIAIIPQDPFLFSGTVRENLDPGGSTYTDAELWSALQKCHLGAVVRRMGGLSAQVNSSEATFSAGQCQLFCLARALLHNAKILCIDEATANVDQETDRHIQRTIRSAFCQSTVLTIAHRVSTVLDSDRVLVMGNGQVLEFDAPDELLQDKSSYFYNIAHQEFL